MTLSERKAHRAYLKMHPGQQVQARILWVSPYTRAWWIKRPFPEAVRMAQVPLPKGVTLAQVQRAINRLRPCR